MMLQLFARLAPLVPARTAETSTPEETIRAKNREQLYSLLCSVQGDITRTEQLFNFAEEDALIDNLIYTLKSLRAQQQYLVQNIRRLEGIGAPPVAAQAKESTEISAELTVVSVLPREGFAMG